MSRTVYSQSAKSVVDQPHVLLLDQGVRDLTDVYRREKDFLREKHRTVSCNVVRSVIEPTEVNEPIPSREFYVQCQCDSSLVQRMCQRVVNGVKLSVEFFLFVAYVVGRRDQLIDNGYPSSRNSSSSRRRQVKQTTTHTFCDIH